MPEAVSTTVVVTLATALFCFDFVVADGATRMHCVKPATFRLKAPSSVERAPFGTFNTSGNWSYLVPRYPEDVNATLVVSRKGQHPLEYSMTAYTDLLARLKGSITIFSHDLPSRYSSQINDLIEQLLQLEDSTVIHLRWNTTDCDAKGNAVRDFYYCPEGSSFHADLYQQAAGDSRLVARQAARFLNGLLSSSDSDNLDNVHYIGFGIGAHIGAFLAEELSFADLRLGRLSALDPAPFLFEDLTPLSRDSARFVDVVHTSACFGMAKPVGHVDFYVNGGETQPGCSTDMCSHVRALTLYATSIAKCGMLRHATEITPNTEGVSAVFGHWCYRDNVTGSFQTETGFEYPYCSVPQGSRAKVHSSPASSAAFVNYTLIPLLLGFFVHVVHSYG